jgi:hypothetical protein
MGARQSNAFFFSLCFASRCSVVLPAPVPGTPRVPASSLYRSEDDETSSWRFFLWLRERVVVLGTSSACHESDVRYGARPGWIGASGKSRTRRSKRALVSLVPAQIFSRPSQIFWWTTDRRRRDIFHSFWTGCLRTKKVYMTKRSKRPAAESCFTSLLKEEKKENRLQ